MKNNIKKFRKEVKMTQAELSEKSGVSRTIISNLESEVDVVTTTLTLKKISNALGKNINEIFFCSWSLIN